MTGPNFDPTALPSPVPSGSAESAGSTGGHRSESIVESTRITGSTLHLTGWTAAYANLYREGAAEFPPACLHYVLEVVRQAARRGTTSHTLSAREVLGAFRTATRTDFGLLCGGVLEDWGLRFPADLGRAVALLGRAGCLTLDDGDALEFYSVETSPLISSSLTQPLATRPVASPGEQGSP